MDHVQCIVIGFGVMLLRVASEQVPILRECAFRGIVVFYRVYTRIDEVERPMTLGDHGNVRVLSVKNRADTRSVGKLKTTMLSNLASRENGVLPVDIF